MRTKRDNYFFENQQIKHWWNLNATIPKHLICFQFVCQWCEIAWVCSDWGMRWGCICGFIISGKKLHRPRHNWHVSNLGLWGWLRKVGASSGSFPWWWLGWSKGCLEFQNGGRKDTFISSRTNEVKQRIDLSLKALYMLILQGYQFCTVNWSCQSQLLLSKGVLASHPDKNYVKYQKWEGPSRAGKMTGVQGTISYNSQWKGKQRNSFALRKFTPWFPDPTVCQLNKHRKKTDHKKAHVGALCDYACGC